MDMEIITRVREQLGDKLVWPDVDTSRTLKHAAAQKAFVEMVKLNGVNSLELFDRIHRCFEEHSLKRPYHDWYHTCCVVEGTIQGLRYLLKGRLPDLADTLQKEVNSTILAAAFHDVGHSGVKEPDIVNVSRSIMIAHRFLADAGIQDKGDGAVAVDIPFLLESLQSTQFPFKREPLNEYQAILRDADLLQILEPTWFDDLYINMYKEFLEGNPALDFRQFCLNEMVFIKSAKFHSQWFRNEKDGTFLDTALPRVEKAYSAVCSLSRHAM
ncbi:HD domain-containing protein [Stenotrophomonas acidaminiphila]|uniref:HD domain-containing protein n=1 Tax=Stenotrophomonas acidaminiphila TaxID=128780 RepID=UPI002ABE30B1|nr:HD domain-containing protein [Stenotrophomonas acidaminiphila]WPU55910.1 HD domain-containing protein [Stenotrophomonas acidaminiphila]